MYIWSLLVSAPSARQSLEANSVREPESALSSPRLTLLAPFGAGPQKWTWAYGFKKWQSLHSAFCFFWYLSRRNQHQLAPATCCVRWQNSIMLVKSLEVDPELDLLQVAADWKGPSLAILNGSSPKRGKMPSLRLIFCSMSI